jgi:hypothetical protein
MRHWLVALIACTVGFTQAGAQPQQSSASVPDIPVNMECDLNLPQLQDGSRARGRDIGHVFPSGTSGNRLGTSPGAVPRVWFRQVPVLHTGEPVWEPVREPVARIT